MPFTAGQPVRKAPACGARDFLVSFDQGDIIVLSRAAGRVRKELDLHEFVAIFPTLVNVTACTGAAAESGMLLAGTRNA
jgi:hypothetical protein